MAGFSAIERDIEVARADVDGLQINYSTGRPISWQTSVGLTLIWDVPPSCPAAQSVLPISHQPRQNQAEGGTVKVKVNPTQLSDQMSLHVLVY